MTAIGSGLITIIGSVAVFAGTAAAQPVVVAGAGDPNVDVPSVHSSTTTSTWVTVGRSTE